LLHSIHIDKWKERLGKRRNPQRQLGKQQIGSIGFRQRVKGGAIMFRPEIMGYVLFLPSFIIFFLPFLFLPLLLAGERLAFARVQNAEKKTSPARDRNRVPAGERRESPRKKLEGVIALVTDGVNCCRVSVNNVSQRGICFACPPRILDRDSERMGVMLTGAGGSIHMQVQPRWKSDNGAEQSIGAAIVETLGNWQEFTDNVEKSRYIRAA